MNERASFTERVRGWAANTSLLRYLAYALVLAAVVSGVATVATLTGDGAAPIDVKKILNLIYIDGLILLLLGLVVTWRLVTLWQERRSGQAGAGLHLRLVMLFGLVAVTPAILVGVFSALFINYGLDTWFSNTIKTAVNQSQVVANAYLKEHRKNIYADAFAIAGELNANAPLLGGNPRRLSRILSRHAALRSLSEVLLVNRNGRVMARSEFSLSVERREIPEEVIEKASRGEIAVQGGKNEDQVRAIVRLKNFVDAFLLVERSVDPQVISHIKRIEDAHKRYLAMERERGGIQVSFVMIFVVVALLLLLVAIWIGLTVATQLAKPISSLILAAERVSEGDLSVRVEATDSPDEISTLSRTFNAMTEQLKSTQEGLIDANRQIDERRRFTETVLAGVSAGVIGLDTEGRIHLPNRSASELLGMDLGSSLNRKLGDVVPEMAELLGEVMERPGQTQQAETKISRNGQFHTLMVSITTEELNGDVIGYIVTFDDVTELLSAQRKAAWSDVARRIAHEIKNPLTPLQLSAERLQRKYLSEIKSDPETFLSCTETIIRQVEDLHRMVDEFSSFARMPQLSLKNENLSEICRQAILLERNRQPDIQYDAVLSDQDVTLYCDHRQVSRALTNLLKNAAESITSRRNGEGTAGEDEGVEVKTRGKIRIVIRDERNENKDGAKNAVTVIIEDNGRGLPRDHREDLTEPYVTTRTKGTGLGLAIVKKIMEDHNGHLLLEDGPDGGAAVSLVSLPIEETADKNAGGEDGEEDPIKVATSLLAREP